MEVKQCMLLFLPLLLLAVFSGRLDLIDRMVGRSSAEDAVGTVDQMVKRRGGIHSSDSAVPVPIVANLTECHPSFTDADRPIYCCPSWKDADQEIVDFQFPDPSSPMRIRRPIHLLDAEYRAKYERAVDIMRRLPDDHPHSYRRQANMHCIYCTGAYNQQNTSALFKIHRSWLFFPWHRAFIYFHERILAKLIGDDTFALVYWAWDHPDGMFFPEMFRHGALTASQRDPLHLYQAANNNFKGEETNISDSEMILDNLAFMYQQMISGARKTELFMGCKLRHGVDGFCSTPGTVERAPHNTLHSWVGSVNNPEREYMGAFYSAALDPSFFGHHGEIDRMWIVWKEMRGGQEPEFSDEDWLNSEFTFYDENVRLVRIKVRDVLDYTKLRYRYQPLDLHWLNARPKPSVPPRIARSILKKRHAESLLRMRGGDQSSSSIVTDLQEGSWTLDRAITVKVDRPRTSRTQKEKEEEEEILHIYGIDAKRSSFARFDVFINAVEETVLSPRSREFAGTFADLQQVSRSRARDGTAMKTSLKLGITEVLEDLEAEEDEFIWVTLVPAGDDSVRTTVEGIRIDYMR